MLTVAAPAKINLFLRVLDREPTGFHGIQTLFCAVELADTIQLGTARGSGIRLDVEGPRPGPDEQNLASRAARMFLEAAGQERMVHIQLSKRIPAGGGLGGGSSDAAATLRGLDTLLPGRVPPHRLQAIAAELGSDVPFFLSGEPWALGAGRGELLTPVAPLPPRAVLIAMPPFPVSTADAYRWLDEDRERREAPARSEEPVRVRAPSTWEELARLASNDFEAPVFRRHPPLRALRDTLREAGAAPALLAGSGSTVFGVFQAEAAAEAAAATVRQRGREVRIAITRTATR